MTKMSKLYFTFRLEQHFHHEQTKLKPFTWWRRVQLRLIRLSPITPPDIGYRLCIYTKGGWRFVDWYLDRAKAMPEASFVEAAPLREAVMDPEERLELALLQQNKNRADREGRPPALPLSSRGEA
jgi:hypothetical protein